MLSHSDLEVLKGAREDKPPTPLEMQVLLLQALSAARSAEMQVAELKERLGMDVALLDRNPAAVKQLYDDANAGVPIATLRSPHWLRFWAAAFLAIDQNYLLLASTVLNTKEPWLPLLDFSNAVTERLAEECADTMRCSEALQGAYQYFKVAQHHLYAVGFIMCRALYGRKVANAGFPNRRSAKSSLRRVLM